MCDPVTIGGIALSAVGSAVQASEQNKQIERGNAARSAAYEAEMIRQRKFRDEAQPMVQSAVQQQGAERSLGDLVTAQGARQNAMTGAIEQPGNYAPAMGGVANEEIIRQSAKAAKEASDNAMRAGQLGGWGDLQFSQALGMKNTGRNMDTVSDFAGGSVRLLPMEQDVAQYNATRKGPGMLGSLLQVAGKGAGLAGMTGFNPLGGGIGGGYAGGTFTNPLTGLRVGGV